MSAFRIISTDERMAERKGVKLLLAGGSGVGKTTQLRTLPEQATLFMDLEAGDLAVADWHGDSIRPRTWEECRDFAVFLGGPNPALRSDQVYSQAHYDHVCAKFGDPTALDKYDSYFIDSLSVAGRLSFQWAQGQPDAFSDKTGKPDTRGAYGLHGREMLSWLTHLQHTRGKNVIFVCILDKKLDDFNRVSWSLQIEGSKTGLELPGIVDELITLSILNADDGTPYRAFVCQTLNTFGYPAKDRSGRLDMIEEPHLGKLLAKINGPVKPASERLNFHTPTPDAGTSL
jgi:hypothetical protein